MIGARNPNCDPTPVCERIGRNPWTRKDISHPFWPHGDGASASFLDAVLLDYIICFGQVRRDAVADAWRRHVRKEQSMLIALAAARTGSGHLVVELVMPFVAGRRLGDAPFYAY